MSWSSFFQDRKCRIEFIVTIIVTIPTLLLFSQFLSLIELREGVVLNDPLLRLFNPIDLALGDLCADLCFNYFIFIEYN